LQELVAEKAGRLIVVEAADVDAVDGDAVGDLVAARVVVGVGGEGATDEEDDEDPDGDDQPAVGAPVAVDRLFQGPVTVAGVIALRVLLLVASKHPG
jgi:hypothetical protein